MESTTVVTLAALILVAALLYASVGHGGGSGYLAAMALFSLAPEVMKPTALTLNILVSAIGTVKFYRAGYFSWAVFWPFALASVPLAFVGGSIALPGHIYQPIVGLVLLFAAYRLWRSRHQTMPAVKKLPRWLALVLGAAIGLLSGLVGVGGGIFLSPLLVIAGWANARQASAVAAPFILVNSVSGLLGHVAGVAYLPGALALWAAAAVIGGWVGADYGSRRLAGPRLRQALAVVLVIAGLKLLV
jgi:uncharacterized protein